MYRSIRKKDLEIKLLQGSIEDSKKQNVSKKTIYKNRRQDFRLELYNVSAEITILSSEDKRFNQILGKKFTGMIKDLSASGLKLLSEYNLPVKGKFKVKIEFSINQNNFVLHAFLLRKEEHLKENLISYGFQFVEMNRKTKEELIINLHKLEAERRKEIS